MSEIKTEQNKFEILTSLLQSEYTHVRLKVLKKCFFTQRMSAACFLRGCHILQACQRRQHVIGGCILYKNR